ncbi:MBL fold metallo-hydrolase [Mesomycoplasma lagogenitalium]|uniref:MBL fold metallo-hydrolase n=1 Tax=Mesomycoplasma lagogenitalium TaxID=171286 RepID=A0ABY8LT87_9BACT|nr:MBL fold metallo-hydrolase [Mesomycoplasma lagogenitalium]WGI36464.1 MBL fold metallo-hydrolase [Mesomycoplasma lagogenitalium]
MFIQSFGSSSAGNSYLITDNNDINESIVIDLGINIIKNIEYLSTLLKVKYVFISHEHSDHTKYLKTFLKFNIKTKVIINKECFNELARYDSFYERIKHRFIFLNYGEYKEIDFLTVWAFKCNHNSAANNGYVINFINKNKKILFFTDCGSLDLKQFKNINFKNINAYLIESNHQEKNPSNIKEDIQQSKWGHFSFKQSAEFIDWVKMKIKNNYQEIKPLFVLLHTSYTYEKQLKELDKNLNVDFVRLERIVPTLIKLN